jgi:hypothetical protein
MYEFASPLDEATIRWEDKNVILRDRSLVGVVTGKAIATHIADLCKLPIKAPTVRRVDPGDEDLSYTEDALAAMDRGGTLLTLYRPEVPTTVIIHEMAHLLVTDPLDYLEGRKPQELEMHGPIWLTNYLWLLDRLMGPGYNTFYLRSTMPAELQPDKLPFHPIIWGQPRVGL